MHTKRGGERTGAGPCSMASKEQYLGRLCHAHQLNLQRYAVTWGVEWDVRLAGGNWWDHVLNAPTLPTFSRDSANLIAADSISNDMSTP